MIRIETAEKSDDVLTTAFIHPKTQARSIILVNNGAAQTVQIPNKKLPQDGWVQYQVIKDRTINTLPEQNISSIQTIELPAQSITTLHHNGNWSGLKTLK